MALPFNTIAVSDNQSQGTPGMRASLISREVIADSIELMVHAHDFDALVCIVGCDKTVPAALMALARVDKPAVRALQRPDARRAARRRGVTIQEVWEAVGAHERGAVDARRAGRARARRLPRPGHLRRALHRQHDGRRARLPGLAAVGDGLIPADAAEEKAAAAARAGRCAVALAAAARRARAFLDRRALLNAMAGIAATGGSTNGVLHLLAIAREAGVELTLDELTAVAARHAGDREPGALAAAGWPRTCTAPADAPAVIAELVRGGLLDGDAPTVQGGTLARRDGGRAGARRRGRLHASSAPFKPSGRLLLAARQPRAGRQRRQARGDRAHAPDRPGARVRRRGGLRRGGALRRRRSPATCS